MAPPRNRMPMRKAVWMIFAVRLVFLNVSFMRKERYKMTAEKNTSSKMMVKTIAMIVRSRDIMIYLFGFSHSIMVLTVSSVKLIMRMPSRKVL